MTKKIPRDSQSDYSKEIVQARQDFFSEHSGKPLEHLKYFSFDPANAQGNIEHFTGVAQVPLGFAGPLLVNGEHARGEFYVPMATTEGTLVASYNRGMRLAHDLGGVTVTVADDAMQRAPVFGFENARQAKQFAHWIKDTLAACKWIQEEYLKVGKI